MWSTIVDVPTLPVTGTLIVAKRRNYGRLACRASLGTYILLEPVVIKDGIRAQRSSIIEIGLGNMNPYREEQKARAEAELIKTCRDLKKQRKLVEAVRLYRISKRVDMKTAIDFIREL